MEKERAAHHPNRDRVIAAADLAQRPPPPELCVGVGRRSLHLRRVRREEEGEEEEVSADRGQDPEGDNQRGRVVGRRGSGKDGRGKNGQGPGGSRLETAVRSSAR